MHLAPLLEAIRSQRTDDVAIERWSIYAAESRKLDLGIKDRHAGGVHTPLRMAESCGARYLLVWSDGKVSRGFLERSQVESRPREALGSARAAAYDDPDAAHVVDPAPVPDVELFDAGAAAQVDGDTDDLARRLALIRRLVAEHGFRTWSGSFSASRASARLINSAGVDLEAEGTSAGWHVTLDGEIGDGFGARAPESDERFEARMDRLIDLALRLRQDAVPMGGGLHTLILHPRVVADYVLDTLIHNLTGSVVAHGEGHFRREQFGDGAPVLREDLSLRLDPLQPLKSGSYRFTTEGVPAARCTYLEAGRLVRPILDVKYAHRLDRPPTPLPYSMDTLEFAGPPPLSLQEALGETGEGALVLSVLGVHTQDSASGDFSLAAPQVLRVRDGVLAGRLRATLSGNLFELLRDASLRLVRFEDDPVPGLVVRCRLDPK